MKLFSYYTPTHARMFNNFLLKSIERFNEYTIIVKKDAQICESGLYGTKGFNIQTFNKLDFVLSSNNWDSGEIAMFCDADVIFLKPTKDHVLGQMPEHDIIFQNDGGRCCTGFYVFRCNQKVKRFFEMAYSFRDSYGDEQICITEKIDGADIKYKLFGPEIWNLGFSDPTKVHEQLTEIPKDILVYHANWLLGLDRKEKALQLCHDTFFKNH